MPGTVIFSGPFPPAGDWWCSLCAGAAKGQAEETAAASPPADGQALSVKISSGPAELRPAVAYGMLILPLPPQAGQGAIPVLAPLCWDHLQGLKTIRSSIAVAGANSLAPPGQRPGWPH